LSASSTKPQSRSAWLAPVPASDRRFVSIWRRFVSMGYEVFLLVGPVLVVAFLYTVLTGDPPSEAHANSGAALDPAARTASDLLRRMGLQVCVYGAIAGYFVWGWSRGRVTLPMQTLRIQLVDTQSGGPLSRSQALKRFVWATLSVLTGLWILVPLFRRDRQTLHDLMAGTQLIHRAASPT
jgi:uncharacterized RDD family membrane protein YckC